ncbi:PD-(D/E)XK nuclease family protein [uncultured Duncaniella sp.]|uniref:PD-(D/E)XK nuclease family protein n=1 Tax=uncultured Duncaniella sp. TaxID=2768039 RepID=UPI0026670FA7|nr:PD-(D/E)XK nuclease family protein [uncultured Duncaniella sp.]
MNWNEFLEGSKIKGIIKSAKRDRGQAQDQRLGLNIFMLTSDYYYRENYHSDIIKEFLAPEGSHWEGNLYLSLFIQMLKNHGAEIDESLYGTDSKVDRETHKIDILIKGDKRDADGKFHFIIIENKINDAVDMYRQIPRYVEIIEKEEYGIVDAVVYIPKNPYKSPNKTGWDEDEIKRIDRKLHIIPAHHTSETNLVDNWILPCVERSNNADAKSILRQYAKLIKSLTPQIMSDNNTQEFIKSIAADKIEDIIVLRQIIDEIPAQMATNLREKIYSDEEWNDELSQNKCYSWTGQQNTCVVDIKGSSLQIYIYTYLDKSIAYVLSVRDWEKKKQKIDWLEKSNDLNEFGIKLKEDQTSYFCTFAFNQEGDVVRCVKEIIKARPK